MLTKRVNSIKPSPTIAVSNRAQELKDAGQDIIGLGAGEPDFDTPEHIKQAAIAAIQTGDTKYTAVDGTPALKNAIISKLKKENNLQYTNNQVLVSCGAKHSLFNLFQSILQKGDEVIIPAPYWVSYPDMVKLADATPITVAADINNDFLITAKQLGNSLTENTKLLILNSPSNPTGSVYRKQQLAELGAVLEKHPNILIATDDIYEHILWTGKPFNNIVNTTPSLYDRTIVINGVSKVYAMTGWRIGYAAGPTNIIAAMKKIQSQSSSNPNSIAQAASVAALEGNQHCISEMVKHFKQRHDEVVTRLNNINGIRAITSQGTFYTFPDISEAMQTLSIDNDVDFCAHLLEQTGVATVPGSAFGMAGYMRISYATDLNTLNDAMDRIEKLLGRK